MAVRLRDRVGQAFELLAAGLEPYVDRRMRATSRSGANWLRDVQASARLPREATLNDPAVVLRIMADYWELAFRDELTRSDRNLVFELRDVRNRWAHNERFSVDDAYRALDSIERLLVSIDAMQASDVGKAKDELGRAKYEEASRKAAQRPQVLVAEPTAGLAPWREVIEPHDDVARGRFALAEFAADLFQVAQGEGRAEYVEPTEFFERTFLTAGLRQLLAEAVRRFAGGEGGVPVVDLQTTFGGGKTHSMIALYHLFSGTPLDRFPPEVRTLVGEVGVDGLPPVRRAVLVGTELKPGQEEVKPDGTVVGTMWGELAWQLGGAEAFDIVAGADRSRTNPGDALRKLFAQFSPCLILVDEWVAYFRGLAADDSLRGGTFDTHYSFAQALTQAARATDGVLLVASLPASDRDGSPVGSDAEVGGAAGREALRRLRAVVGRMESSWRPATAEESFEIVRRRLFQPIEEAKLGLRDTTARVFGDFYRSQSAEFPAGCREAAYVDRIKRAYPIHPELFARLYEDWSTLERFQRTRGVLRLMATVVYELWSSGDQSPLILPASVPLAEAEVAAELTRNLDDNWKPILDADVDGAASVARGLDDEVRNLGRYAAARRVARTVFLGSAPRAGSPHRGIEAARVRLGCAFPGETVAIYGDALNRLADRATYFYTEGSRYWFGTQASVARLARDRAERYRTTGRDELHEAIVKRLKHHESRRGAFAGVHAAPRDLAGVADVPEVRLVILDPQDPHVAGSDASAAREVALAMLESRGTVPRTYRNMLVFLAADQRRLEDLEQAEAESLAWSSVVAEAHALGLDLQQSALAANRSDDAKRTAELRLVETYHWLLVPKQPEPTGPIELEAVKVNGEGELAERASRVLVHGGGLYTAYPPVLLRLQLDTVLAPLWENGHTTVNEVWEAYARYLYLHRLRDIEVLCDAVRGGTESTIWAAEGFGVADAIDEPSGVYLGLKTGELAPRAIGTTLIVRPDRASAQRDAEREPVAVDVMQDEATAEPVDVEEVVCRFYGVVDVEPERLGRDAGRIAEEVVAHLAGLVGTDVEVTIEIRATNEAGFPEHVVKIVQENVNALRFREKGFEPW